MAEMSYPALVISKNRRDRRAIWLKRDAGSGCLQLRHVILAGHRIVDVIDVKGRLFESATVIPSGVCWNNYWKAGIIGALIAFTSLIFATLLMNTKIVAKGDGVQISLEEAKELILTSARVTCLRRSTSEYKRFSKKIAAAGGFEKLFESAGTWWD